MATRAIDPPPCERPLNNPGGHEKALVARSFDAKDRISRDPIAVVIRCAGLDEDARLFEPMPVSEAKISSLGRDGREPASSPAHRAKDPATRYRLPAGQGRMMRSS